MFPRLWLPAALVVSLAARISGLTESLWYDEALRTRQSLSGDRLMRLLLHDVHNPLYNAFMAGWIRVFGDSEVSIRLPSLLAAYGAALILWWWSRLRFGRCVADLALVWTVLSPVHWWYSTEAKNN